MTCPGCPPQWSPGTVVAFNPQVTVGTTTLVGAYFAGDGTVREIAAGAMGACGYHPEFTVSPFDPIWFDCQCPLGLDITGPPCPVQGAAAAGASGGALFAFLLLGALGVGAAILARRHDAAARPGP